MQTSQVKEISSKLDLPVSFKCGKVGAIFVLSLFLKLNLVFRRVLDLPKTIKQKAVQYVQRVPMYSPPVSPVCISVVHLSH